MSGCSAVGSARGLGPWGRGFESSHPDQIYQVRLIQKKPVRQDWLLLFISKSVELKAFRGAIQSSESFLLVNMWICSIELMKEIIIL